MCSFADMPVELLRQIIPDLDAAAELGATCTWLRAAIPRDLYVLDRDNLMLSYFRTSTPRYTAVKCMVCGQAAGVQFPCRLSYLRYVSGPYTVLYPRKTFTGRANGVVPAQSAEATGDAYLFVRNSVAGILKTGFVTGSVDYLVTLAGLLADDSTLFARADAKLPGDPFRWDLFAEGSVGGLAGALVGGAIAGVLVFIAIIATK